MNKNKKLPSLDLSTIDKDIVSIVELCNKRGHVTYYSCSGHPETEDYTGYIMFEYSDKLFKMLLNIIDYVDDKMVELYPIPYVYRMDRVFYHHQTSLDIENDKSGSETNPPKHLVLRFKLAYAITPNQYDACINNHSVYKVIEHEDYYKLLEEAFRLHLKIELELGENNNLAYMLNEAIMVTAGNSSDAIFELCESRSFGESETELANLIIDKVIEGL